MFERFVMAEALFFSPGSPSCEVDNFFFFMGIFICVRVSYRIVSYTIGLVVI